MDEMADLEAYFGALHRLLNSVAHTDFFAADCWRDLEKISEYVDLDGVNFGFSPSTMLVDTFPQEQSSPVASMSSTPPPPPPSYLSPTLLPCERSPISLIPPSYISNHSLPQATVETAPHPAPPKVTQPPKAPRARNAFTIFRSSFIKQCNLNATVLSQTDYSKAAGDVWKGMSDEEKRPYREEAAFERLHGREGCAAGKRASDKIAEKKRRDNSARRAERRRTQREKERKSKAPSNSSLVGSSRQVGLEYAALHRIN